MGKSKGLDFDGADIEELAEDQKEELTTEELSELQSKQQKTHAEDHPLRKRTTGGRLPVMR